MISKCFEKVGQKINSSDFEKLDDKFFEDALVRSFKDTCNAFSKDVIGIENEVIK